MSCARFSSNGWTEWGQNAHQPVYEPKSHAELRGQKSRESHEEARAGWPWGQLGYSVWQTCFFWSYYQ